MLQTNFYQLYPQGPRLARDHFVNFVSLSTINLLESRSHMRRYSQEGLSQPHGGEHKLHTLVYQFQILSLFRPITSYGALDLPTYFLDLSPFVPTLTDGKPHRITLDVSSAEDDHTILQNWFVSGVLQVITDPSQKRTTGQIKSYIADPFAQSSASVSTGANGDVNFTITATRKIHIESEFLSGSGKSTRVVWAQDLQYSNLQNYLKNGSIQVTKFL